MMSVRNPEDVATFGLASSAFARHYSQNLVDFFSYGYLDVSVQAVPHVHLFDSVHVTRVLLWWVSPFGNLRINAHLQLPEAYRSLSRPSSAPDAKAFTLCSL